MREIDANRRNPFWKEKLEEIQRESVHLLEWELTIKTLVEIDIVYAGIYISTPTQKTPTWISTEANILKGRAILPLSNGQNFSLSQFSILYIIVSIKAQTG